MDLKVGDKVLVRNKTRGEVVGVSSFFYEIKSEEWRTTRFCVKSEVEKDAR